MTTTAEFGSFGSNVMLVLRTLVSLARDPGRLDLVLSLNERINFGRARKNVARLATRPDGAKLLAERPRIDRSHVDFAALAQLPDGTLGREYVRFLAENAITPDAFASLPDVPDERVAWLMLRMRQTHDLWHVVTGYAPDVRGEILLQAFTFAQMKAPSTFILATFGSVRYSMKVRAIMRDALAAYRRGKRAAFLAPFAWEDHWATPVAELRALLAV